jgi:protocatechuate 3,4-dioxygenase beta subunit
MLRAMEPITRRRTLGLAGAAGAAYLLASGAVARALLGRTAEAQAAASCVLTPAKTEGPYFVDERLNRSDIRIDPLDGSVQDGVELSLRFVVVRSDGDCAPVSGAQVDVWHANAAGLYSDESANGTEGRKYLRGYQLTDEDGVAEFVTIFPGWYRGRAIHVHFKIRKDEFEFTSQLFFDEATTQQVLTDDAYSSRGTPDTTNGTDMIYGSDGSQLTVALARDSSGGLAGTFTVALSGLPADEGVTATLERRRWERTESGRRVLKLTLDVDEAVELRARILRGGTRLARKRVERLAAGRRTVHVPVPARVRGGLARLVLVLADGGGNTRIIRRTVRVPRR